MKYSQNSQNYDYYQGDHWPLWIGPRIPADNPDAVKLMGEVQRVFQSVNLIRECCDRHVAALVGKMPHWYLKDESGDRLPTTDADGNLLDTAAAQAERELQRWLDRVFERADAGVTDQNDPFLSSVTDLIVGGTGYLRLWTPDRYAAAADPIDRIHLHAPNPSAVLVERNTIDGFIEKISYSSGSELQTQTLEGEIVTVAMGNGSEPLAIDTGGRWLVSLMHSPAMITEQIKQNQNAVNHAATMLMRNQELGGFLERIFLNAQPPGEWTEDATAPGGYKFVSSDRGLIHGPGEDIFLGGIPQGDPLNPSYSTPSVQYRDPVQVSTFLESIAAYRAFIYHAFGQGHLLIDGSSTISGVSRVQMRQDFETILMRQKRVIESAIANILNVVLKLLNYEGLTAVVQLRVSTGKLSPEERAAIIVEYDKGLLSRATAMALLGSVEDTDAELSLIAEDDAEQAAASRVRSPIGDPFDIDNPDPDPQV